MSRRTLLTATLAIVSGCNVVFGLDELPPITPPTDGWSTVTAGALHTCATRRDGAVSCWGRNDGQQLGLAVREADVPTPLTLDTSSFVMLDAGDAHTCGIQANDDLACWGSNSRGQLGAAIVGSSTTPVFVAADVAQVALGRDHGCAVSNGGFLSCWGANDFGQLGNGDVTSSTTPILVGGAWRTLASGHAHTCGIRNDGTLWCWGDNAGGALGTGGGERVTTPSMVGGDRDWVEVAAGRGFTCARRETGTVWCWGGNDHGELGRGSVGSIIEPVPAPIANDPGDWVALDAGLSTICGVRADGTLACWGANGADQLGGMTPEVPTSTTWTPLPYAREVAVGWTHVCAISNEADAVIVCAGNSGTGALGAEGRGSVTRPVIIDGSYSRIATGGSHTCATNASDRIACWGDNSTGQLGTGTSRDAKQPTPIASELDFDDVATGTKHTCAAERKTNQTFCWGDNRRGQLGIVNTAAVIPTPGLSLNGMLYLSLDSRGDHSCGRPSGTSYVYCWGENLDGQAGSTMVGDFSRVALDTTMPGEQSIAAGSHHTCAIGTGGIACLGDNTYGQLGDGTTLSRSTPMVIPNAAVDMAGVTATDHTCTFGDALNCWGRNDFGQLGNGTTTSSSTPVHIADDDWDVVSAGALHTCGIKGFPIPGTLWCWGNNSYGQLGLGTFDDTSDLTQVGTDTDWTDVSAGDFHTCARKGLATYCWGRNVHGEVGNDAAWGLSPVILP